MSTSNRVAAQHTPGPWQQNHRDPLQICDADGGSRGCSPIAKTVGPEAVANAKLIAAAPDLVAALVKLQNMGLGAAAFEICSLAIARATGEAQ